jgi:3-hydroxyacyl-CoA dehydrogenase
MRPSRPVRRIAPVGRRTVGASWATQHLACGLDVIATDLTPAAEENLRAYVGTYGGSWRCLTRPVVTK